MVSALVPALLAETVHALPPEVDCVAYFLTRPTGDADRERFLVAVVPQLAWQLGTDPPSALDEHVFRQLWEQVLVASRLSPGLPDDVDPANLLAAFTSDQPYMLPYSPDAARLRELADQEITQLLRRATDDPDMDTPGLLTAARTGTSG